MSDAVTIALITVVSGGLLRILGTPRRKIKDFTFVTLNTMLDQLHTATRRNIIEELSKKVESSESGSHRTGPNSTYDGAAPPFIGWGGSVVRILPDDRP